jgi:hypothetical protein
MMNQKHQSQLQRAKASIKLLSKNVSNTTTYEELQTELNFFMKSYIKDANKANNRPNKSIIGFINYLKDSERRPRKVIKVEPKKRGKKTYLDYIPNYIILREQGLSYRKIAEYSAKHFRQKVSKDTIRVLLTKLNEEGE